MADFGNDEEGGEEVIVEEGDDEVVDTLDTATNELINALYLDNIIAGKVFCNAFERIVTNNTNNRSLAVKLATTKLETSHNYFANKTLLEIADLKGCTDVVKTILSYMTPEEVKKYYTDTDRSLKVQAAKKVVNEFFGDRITQQKFCSEIYNKLNKINANEDAYDTLAITITNTGENFALRLAADNCHQALLLLLRKTSKVIKKLFSLYEVMNIFRSLILNPNFNSNDNIIADHIEDVIDTGLDFEGYDPAYLSQFNSLIGLCISKRLTKTAITLIKHGKYPYKYCGTGCDVYYLPLSIAIRYSNAEFTKFLLLDLTPPADVNLSVLPQYYPINLALKSSYPQYMVELLVKHGANPRPRFSDTRYEPLNVAKERKLDNWFLNKYYT